MRIWSGRKPDLLEHLRDPLPLLLPVARPCTVSGSPTISPAVMRGFSEENGSWKIICIARRYGRSAALPRWVSRAVEPDRAGGRLDQPQHGACDRRFAAAELADQAERLALADREADAVDRVDCADGAAQQPCAPGNAF